MDIWILFIQSPLNYHDTRSQLHPTRDPAVTLQVLAVSAFPSHMLVFSLASNSLQHTLVSSTSSQTCKLCVAAPSILLDLANQTHPVLLLVSSYACTYWSGNVCLPIRWEGLSVCRVGFFPLTPQWCRHLSGVRAFEFSLSFAESLTRFGISWNLQVSLRSLTLLNWVVIRQKVTVKSCLAVRKAGTATSELMWKSKVKFLEM